MLDIEALLGSMPTPSAEDMAARLNGPILSEHDISGVSVYAAGLDEAHALAEADPKVKAGYLTVEAIPWVAVPSKIELHPNLNQGT